MTRRKKAYCAACGAENEYGVLRCRDCGRPLVFPGVDSFYKNPRLPERACDHCGKLYRGPAVYCSLECAVADA